MDLKNNNPLIPLNFDNADAIMDVLSLNGDRVQKLIEGDESINLNISDILLHPIYSVLWTINSRYKYIFGSKDNGKSFQSALKIVTKWLSHPKRCIVVLRKYQSYNSGSTLPDVIKVMNLLAKFTGIRQLSPVSAEDYRRSGKKEIFYYTKTSPIEMHNSVTGQKIFFTGLDRVAAGGLSLEDMSLAYDTIWAEELVDLDTENIDIMDDTSFAKWRIIESTIFRGSKIVETDDEGNVLRDTKTGMEKQKRREGLEWMDEEVIFSYNSHNPDHWLLREIGDKYVPLDPHNVDDCLDMEKSVIRSYYDPDFQNGDGIFVMRTSVYLNGGRDINLVEQMRQDDFTNYAYLYLGATKAIGGLAYSGYEGHIYTEPINMNMLAPLSVGIDHANSKTHGDWFSASFLGTDFGNVTQSLGEHVYPMFNAKYYYDEIGWNNKEMEFKFDDELADLVLDKIQWYVEEFQPYREHLVKYGMAIVVDLSAGSFMQTFMNRIYDRGVKDPAQQDWLGMLRVLPCEGKTKTAIVDGVKQTARKARVERNKRLLRNNMIIFDPKCYMTKKEFIMTSYDDKMEVVDKNRDFVDAMDYAEMVQHIMPNFDRVLMIKENNNKKNNL